MPSPLSVCERNAPRIGLAGPIAELDPAPHHVVIGDGAPVVLAAADRDRDAFDNAQSQTSPLARPSLAVGNGDVQLAVGERKRHGGSDIAPFFRLLAMACSIAALSLPSACRLPFTTTCGV